MWQLFIQDIDGFSKAILLLDLQGTSVLELKNLIQKKFSISCGESGCYLAHRGSILEDSKLLGDYPLICNGSTIFFLPTLLGGAEAGVSLDPAHPVIVPTLPRSDEYCMVRQENYDQDGTVVLMMPCGHPISPGGLLDYCWSELHANKTKICCLLCTREWTVDVIKQYSGVSQEEFQQMEKRLSWNFCITSDDIKQCLKCKSFCSRINPENSCVVCKVCSKKSATSYRFCWYCLRQWNNAGAKSCGYEDCRGKENLERLQKTDRVVVQQHPRVEIFALRACPCCGNIMCCTAESWRGKCAACSTKFCFICLRPKSQGSWFCDSKKVNCALAPIQKKIPHKHDLQMGNT